MRSPERMSGDPAGNRRHKAMAKMFKLEIECDNEAFGERPFQHCLEIARILRETSERLEADIENLYPNSAQWVRDINGNQVGTYKFEDRDRLARGR
jgi:hypothetical protein